MNKLHLLHKAEKLYSVENLTPEMIAEKLIQMLNEGRVIFDISGEEKKNLTVQELLEKFEKDDDIQLDDKMILG